MPSPIPPDLLRFIDANIESVEQLEILRVLSETPDRPRTAGELARECQIKTSDIVRQLTSLQQRGLLRSQGPEATVLYAHGAENDKIYEWLRRLLQCYREHPVTLIRLLYARADDRLKTLADAFRFGKGD